MWDDLYDFSETDEQANSKEQALRNYWEKLRQYRRGEETMGVLGLYEETCFKYGATWDEMKLPEERENI
jgi:hypothetical protein